MEEQIADHASGVSLSMTSLFIQAPFTVQLVMLVLIFASFWAWGMAAQKWLELRRVRADQQEFDKAFWSGEPLDRLYAKIGREPDGHPEAIFVAAMTEWSRSAGEEGRMIPGAINRIERAMNVAVARAAEELQGGLSWLATIGSTAPFIGLFGTVIGIMYAFVEIAAQQNTGLDVVAPRLAEALLATGLGLLAAIPAVILYNHLSAATDRVIARYESFADEFATLLGRQLGG